jgi:hypothetical protein
LVADVPARGSHCGVSAAAIDRSMVVRIKPGTR